MALQIILVSNKIDDQLHQMENNMMSKFWKFKHITKYISIVAYWNDLVANSYYPNS
jgi:hypothetical protein